MTVAAPSWETPRHRDLQRTVPAGSSKITMLLTLCANSLVRSSSGSLGRMAPIFEQRRQSFIAPQGPGIENPVFGEHLTDVTIVLRHIYDVGVEIQDILNLHIIESIEHILAFPASAQAQGSIITLHWALPGIRRSSNVFGSWSKLTVSVIIRRGSTAPASKASSVRR